MRTRTIFKAWQKTMPAYPPPLQVYERDRKRLRQNIAFGAEFERRMDERDAVIPAAKDAEQKHMAWAVCPKKDSEQIHADWDASMWDLRLALYPVEAE